MVCRRGGECVVLSGGCYDWERPLVQTNQSCVIMRMAEVNGILHFWLFGWTPVMCGSCEVT